MALGIRNYKKTKGTFHSRGNVPDVTRQAPAVPDDGLASYDDQLDGRFDVGVQVHSYVVLTNLTDGAVRQTDFALRYFNARGGQCVGDVVSADGTEQLALIARGSGDGDFQFGQLRMTSI